MLTTSVMVILFIGLQVFISLQLTVVLRHMISRREQRRARLAIGLHSLLAAWLVLHLIGLDSYQFQFRQDASGCHLTSLKKGAP